MATNTLVKVAVADPLTEWKPGFWYRRSPENAAFFRKTWERDRLALTFDDVVIRTAYSDILPVDTDVKSFFSRNVPLLVPIASAAMDTVSDSRMGIALAKAGGLAIIHRGFEPDRQAEEVRIVKNYPRIENPVCLKQGMSVKEARELMEEYSCLPAFPVTENGNAGSRVLGLAAKSRIESPGTPDSETVADMIETDCIKVSADTSHAEAYKIMKERGVGNVLLVHEDDTLAGMYNTELYSWFEDSSSYNSDQDGRLLVGAAVGRQDQERMEMLLDAGVDVIVVDLAHGYTRDGLHMLREFNKRYRDNYPADIVLGNITEPDALEAALKAGADGVRVGQGPGSICTTRKVSGTGLPQLTAVYLVARKNRGRIPVNADGGIRYPGDMVKAFAAGAHSVTLGNLLAGTEESAGMIVALPYVEKEKKFKRYRGMGSRSAMEERAGANRGYVKTAPEGAEGLVPYSGVVADIVKELIGGLQSGMGYAGAANLPELQERGRFARITPAGSAEGNVHSVVLVNE